MYNGSDFAKMRGTELCFSGKGSVNQSLANYSKSSGPFTLGPDYVIYDGLQPGSVDYVYKTDDKGKSVDHTQLIVMSNEFLFEKLPISDGAAVGGAQNNGFYFYFTDEDPDSRLGTTICAAIFTEDGQTLKLRIGQGSGAEGYVFDLNKTLNQKFRMIFYWYLDNSMDIYVDGALLGTVANAGS